MFRLVKPSSTSNHLAPPKLPRKRRLRQFMCVTRRHQLLFSEQLNRCFSRFRRGERRVGRIAGEEELTGHEAFLCVWNACGLPAFRVMPINGAFERLAQCAPDSIIGHFLMSAMRSPTDCLENRDFVAELCKLGESGDSDDVEQV